MKHLTLQAVTVLLTFVFGAPVVAAEGSVKIHAPADGATLDAMEQNKLDYEVTPGPDGDHVHLYVDGAEVAILRQLKGSYTLVESDARSARSLRQGREQEPYADRRGTMHQGRGAIVWMCRIWPMR